MCFCAMKKKLFSYIKLVKLSTGGGEQTEKHIINMLEHFWILHLVNPGGSLYKEGDKL